MEAHWQLSGSRKILCPEFAFSSVSVRHDPKKYCDLVFNILRNLDCLYGISPETFPFKCAISIQALIQGAGEKNTDSNRYGLRYDIQGADKERILCIIQSIIEASTSPKAMRNAIYECGEHDKSYVPLYYKDKNDDGVFDRQKYHKTMAREFLKKEYANQAFIENAMVVIRCPTINSWYAHGEFDILNIELIRFINILFNTRFSIFLFLSSSFSYPVQQKRFVLQQCLSDRSLA